MKRLTMLFVVPLLALLSACGSLQLNDSKDRLTVAMEVMTAYAQRVTVQTEAGVLPIEDARKRLELGKDAAKALNGAVATIKACEAEKGSCDMQAVVGAVGSTALDRLEAHFLATKQFSEADAVAVARIIYALMRNSADPAQDGGGGVYSAFFEPLVKRFTAAVDALEKAVAARS